MLALFYIMHCLSHSDDVHARKTDVLRMDRQCDVMCMARGMDGDGLKRADSFDARDDVGSGTVSGERDGMGCVCGGTCMDRDGERCMVDHSGMDKDGNEKDGTVVDEKDGLDHLTSKTHVRDGTVVDEKKEVVSKTSKTYAQDGNVKKEVVSKTGSTTVSGNPPSPDGHKTAFLDIVRYKDSLWSTTPSIRRNILLFVTIASAECVFLIFCVYIFTTDQDEHIRGEKYVSNDMPRIDNMV